MQALLKSIHNYLSAPGVTRLIRDYEESSTYPIEVRKEVNTELVQNERIEL